MFSSHDLIIPPGLFLPYCLLRNGVHVPIPRWSPLLHTVAVRDLEVAIRPAEATEAIHEGFELVKLPGMGVGVQS